MTTSTQPAETRFYIAIFAALLALTALTVGVAFVDLGGFNNAVALVIAGAKAALVAAFFMHVRHDQPLVKATIAAGCVWLAILLSLTLGDFLTRSW